MSTKKANILKTFVSESGNFDKEILNKMLVEIVSDAINSEDDPTSPSSINAMAQSFPDYFEKK